MRLCMFVQSHISKACLNHVQTSQNFPHMLTVATAQTFSDDNTGSTLCSSGFVDDVDNQPGVKSDVSDCLVVVTLIVSISGSALWEGRCSNEIRNSSMLM